MLPEQFAILTAVISFLAGVSYVLATLRGETKPNRVTFWLLAFISLIIILAQLEENVGWAIVSACASLFNTSLVLIVSYANKQAFWQTKKQDYLFGGIALFGVALWQITDDANLAILFSIIADFFAFLPTIVKSYSNPETENKKSYVMWFVAYGFALLTINDWRFSEYAFPAYLTVANLLLVYLLILRPRLSTAP